MKRKQYIIVGLLLISMFFTSCGEKEIKNIEEKEIQKIEVANQDNNDQLEEIKERTIVDLSGKEVIIPNANEINNVIIISPPLLATYIGAVKDTSKLVGVHPGAIKNINPDILNQVVPNWKDINTSFLKGFTSNAEEVLKMNPDIILVYGDFQKEGLENVEVPIVDFYLKDTKNESWSVRVDELMRDIFEIKEGKTLQDEWDSAKEITSKVLDNIKDSDKKTAIMIKNNNAESFTVRGGNYYGDDWLKITGLINKAKDLEGDSAQVTMEQVYNWNPDIVYDFYGMDASAYLDNSIEGKDWSLTKAFETKSIYDMPHGMFNWGAPNTDSPLTLIWMTMKNYPGTIEESFFYEYMKEFYSRQYNVELNDDLIEKILDPTKAK